MYWCVVAAAAVVVVVERGVREERGGLQGCNGAPPCALSVWLGTGPVEGRRLPARPPARLRACAWRMRNEVGTRNEAELRLDAASSFGLFAGHVHAGEQRML
jgi:hypothetical protein